MSKKFDETLTKYMSSKTVVTADIANALFGGLYGSTEGDILEADDVRLIGHVHDGVHTDGHAQRINLVSHVTGKLENTNLADQAVMKANVYRSENQIEAIPWYEVSSGKTLYYLNLSSVTLDAVVTNGNTTDQSISIGSDSESPVGKIDVHSKVEAVDNSDLNQHHLNIINGREKLSFGGVQGYSDGSGGYTLITTNSAHGLVSSDCVVISKTINYNGIFNVIKIGDKSFKVQRSYVAETVAGDEEFRQLSSEVGIGLRISTDTSAVSPGAAITHKRYVSGTTHTDDSVGSLHLKTKGSSSAKDLDTRMTIDKDGNVGIGITSPTRLLHISADGDGSSLAEITQNYTGVDGPNLWLSKARGTASSKLIIQDGDYLGSINFVGYDGSSQEHFASIHGVADETVADNNCPGSLLFKTKPAGSSQSLAERLRIRNDGKVGIGTSAPSRQLEINSSSGSNLRLTYNDSDGSAAHYADFTTTSSGDLTINASGGDITLDDNVAISGSLTVNGTTTTVNSTTLTVDDPLIFLGGDVAPGSDDNKDRGTAFRYHDGSAAKIGFMGWDDSAAAIRFGQDVSIASEVVTFTTAAKIDLQGAELILDADGNTSITADTDNQIDIKIAGADDFTFTANKFDVLSGSTLEVNGTLDLNGTELILDANGNTSITADTDDQIDIRIGGSDVFSIDATKLKSMTNFGPRLTSGAGLVGSPAYSFTGDTDTGVYRSAANELSISTGGTQRIVVTSDGRVGINTPTPAANTQLAVAASSANSTASITSYSTTGTNGGVLKLRHSKTNSIASNTALANGDSIGSVLFHANDGDSFDESASIRCFVDDSSFNDSNHGGKIAFYTTAGASPTNRMTILGNGRVGIGTSNPPTILGIANTGSATATITAYNNGTSGSILRLRHSRGASVGTNTIVQSGDTLGKIEFKGADGSDFDAGAYIAAKVDGTAGAAGADMPGRIVLATSPDGSSTPVERASLNQHGRFSVGTDIAGTSASSPLLSITGDGNNSSGESYAGFFHNNQNQTTGYGIRIQAGVNAPGGAGQCTYLLFADGDGGPGGGIRCGTTVANPEFYNGSDERVKHDIAPTKVIGLDVINGFEMKEFRWNPDFCKYSGLNRIGFIAQNCEEAYPDMVSDMPDDRFDFDVKTVAKGELIPVLVKAVQELSAQVDDLKLKLEEYSNSEGN